MIDPGLLKRLAALVGPEDVLTSPRDLLAYSYDATSKQAMPEAVVFPADAHEVAAVMKAAYEGGVPVVPRGAGTNLSGGTLASRGGIILELSRLNKIIGVDPLNQRAVVEPGVVNLDLQNALAPLGFFYPPDPASQKACTLGGNVGEDAGGPHCLKYGVTSHYVLGLEVVLPQGEVMELGGAVEEVPGYDLVGLFVGSEGTLGVVTKLVLRILPQPETFRTLLAVFESLEDAGKAASAIIGAGIIPGALEIMDQTVTRAIEESVHAGYPLDAQAVLIIELDGLAEGLDRQAKEVLRICRRNRARQVRLARTEEEREALWAGRRGAFGAVARLSPTYAVQDGTVPRSELVKVLGRVMGIARRYRLLIGNVAHAGDGNLHPIVLFDSANPEEGARVEQAGREILALCVAAGGTLSGEHGIGLEKREAMSLVFGLAEMEAMRKVKRVFDPAGNLNPGKVLPERKGEEKGANPLDQKAATTGEEALLRELEEIVGPENVVRESLWLVPYRVNGLVPSLAIFPYATEQVSRIIALANRYRKSVIPWGAGTKQGIGLPPSSCDIVLSLKRMNRIKDLDTANLVAEVEAGVVNVQLQKRLARRRLLFPLDPPDMEASTLGGSLAAGASGPRWLGYGPARGLVLGLSAVLPTGEVVRLGGRVMKNVTGYDLRKMVVGSWGTLGVITEATLRLWPLPEAQKTLLLRFFYIEDAVKTVLQSLSLWPTLAELIDGVADSAAGSPWGLAKDEVLLLIGIQGLREAVECQERELSALARANQAFDVSAVSEGEEGRAWAAYRRVHRGVLEGNPWAVRGKASVPRSKLGEVFRLAKEAGSRYGLETGLMAQAASGILYFLLLPRDAEESRNTIPALILLGEITAGLGGFFSLEVAPAGVREAFEGPPPRSDYSLMKRLKAELDPANILNPGRVVGV